MPDEKPSSPGGSPWTPAVTIAAVILFSIFLLIGAAVLNYDVGRVLGRMSEIPFARGLITYLFAVATIGTAVVLIVYALSPNRNVDSFQHGKEILSLLLGVFGTIVGFYFGREGVAPLEETLMVAPLKLSATSVAPGQTIHLLTVVSGGKAPLKFEIVFGEGRASRTENAAAGGWIDTDVTVPADQKPGPVTLKVMVADADSHDGQQTAAITIQGANNPK